MNKIFLFLFAFFCGYSHAQPSEGDFVLIRKDYVLHPDGSSDMHCRQVVRYNTHVSFNRLYGETFIVYNPQQQQLKINESYTVQISGNKAVTPPNAFNEVLPRFAADAPDYNHLREMVVTHTALEIGATAYLDYTLHTGAGYEPELDRCLPLQETSPVKEYRITVTVPDNKQLSYQLHGLKASPEITKKNGTTCYGWTFRNIAAQSHEYYQPADKRNSPHLIFSTWPSQTEALKWLAAQFKTGNAAVVKTASGNILSKDDLNSRLTAIHQFVADNIAYAAVPAEYAGYRLRDASEVIGQAYGTAGEKAALLMALAGEANAEAYPVAVYPSFVDGTAGSLHAISDVVVGVNSPGNNFLLSPRVYAETDPAISKPNWRYVPVTGNAAEIAGGKCMNAGMVTTIVADIMRVKTESKSLKSTVPCGGQAMDIQSIEQNEEIPMVSGTLPFKENNGYYSFTLPEMPGGVNSWALPYLGSSRQTNLEIPYPVSESYSYTVLTTADMELINRSTSVEKSNSLGQVSIRIEPNALNYYKISRTIILHKSIISPKEYGEFMELINIWRNPSHRTVIANYAD